MRLHEAFVNTVKKIIIQQNPVANKYQLNHIEHRRAHNPNLLDQNISFN